MNPTRAARPWRQEYFKSVKPKLLSAQGIELYTCVFPGPAVHAKQARGAMCRHVITNRVTSPEGLKAFTGTEGEWRYDEKQSSGNDLVFVRGAANTKAKANARATSKKQTKESPKASKATSAPAAAGPTAARKRKNLEAEGAASLSAEASGERPAARRSRRGPTREAPSSPSPPAEVSEPRPPARRRRRPPPQ